MAEAWSGGPCRRLSRLVEESGLTQEELGLRLGVKGPTVSRWCSGERTLNADTLASILEIVGGSADEVLGLSGQVADELRRLREQVERGRAALAGAQEWRGAAALAGTESPAGTPRQRR